MVEDVGITVGAADGHDDAAPLGTVPAPSSSMSSVAIRDDSWTALS